MARLSQLEDILFSVEEQPIFAIVQSKFGERRISIPEKKAIVNQSSGRVLGVVSRGYRLVSNREALDMAYDCCRAVFPDTKPVEWEVCTTDAPASGGHCFIDLIHNTANLDFTFVPAEGRPEAFGPFIRVTNSYNGLRALSFDIGYNRKVCKNGLILRESAIRFKFTHMRRDIGETVQFKIPQDKLARMKANIGEYFNRLKSYDITRSQFEPLMRAVLLVRKPEHAEHKPKFADDWDKLENHIKEMCDRYAVDLGENAYAVFNAITEFASHPPENRCVFRDRHSFQRRAGYWLTDFTSESSLPEFDLQRHIEKIVKESGNDNSTPNTIPRRRT